MVEEGEEEDKLRSGKIDKKKQIKINILLFKNIIYIYLDSIFT